MQILNSGNKGIVIKRTKRRVISVSIIFTLVYITLVTANIIFQRKVMRENEAFYQNIRARQIAIHEDALKKERELELIAERNIRRAKEEEEMKEVDRDKDFIEEEVLSLSPDYESQLEAYRLAKEQAMQQKQQVTNKTQKQVGQAQNVKQDTVKKQVAKSAQNVKTKKSTPKTEVKKLESNKVYDF